MPPKAAHYIWSYFHGMSYYEVRPLLEYGRIRPYSK